MKLFRSTATFLLAATLQVTSAIVLDLDDEASIRNVTASYARGLLSYYKNGAPGTPSEDIGTFAKPYYWWEAGAVWGGLIDYWAYTNDSTYVDTVKEALIANFGPNKDLILPWRKDQEGNDDQGFWAMTIMSAVENRFPGPQQSDPQYIDVAKAAFDNIASRWDMSSCGGGLKWQIYPENSYGYTYKNSISGGTFFALAARLARYTGNQTYVDWADKTWDWLRAVNLISDKYEVFDGSDDTKNCSEVDHIQWTYNNAVFLHGAAVLYDYTDGASKWKDRVSGLLAKSASFFSPFDNSSNVMFEPACDPVSTCNTDQYSFKAYLGRFLAKTAVLAPFTADTVNKYIRGSADAAAKTCSGGQDGMTCGSKWYTGGFDGSMGIGQQLSALEVTQALLAAKAGPPAKFADAGTSQPTVSTSVAISESSTIAAQATSKLESMPTAPSSSSLAQDTLTSSHTSVLVSSGSVVSDTAPSTSVAAEASSIVPSTSSSLAVASSTLQTAVTSAPASRAASSVAAAPNNPLNSALGAQISPATTTAPDVPMATSNAAVGNFVLSQRWIVGALVAAALAAL